MLHLIESRSYDLQDTERLKTAITDLGQSYIDIDYVRWIQLSGSPDGLKEKFTFWGSPGMFRRIEEMRLPNFVGVDMGTHFDAKQYHSCLYEFGLNTDATFLTIEQLKSILPYLRMGNYFLRPSRGDKTFHGGVFDLHEEFQKDKLKEVTGGARDDTEVLIAPPREILNEYRCFCKHKTIHSYGDYWYKDEVISCSRYLHKGQICLDSEGIESVAKFTKNVMCDIGNGPGEIFVMDVAQLYDGTFCIVEMNHAQTSAFYKADVKAIVNEIIKEYDTND